MESDQLSHQIDQLTQQAGRSDLSQEQRQAVQDQLRQATARSEELQRNERDEQGRANSAREDASRQQRDAADKETQSKADAERLAEQEEGRQVSEEQASIAQQGQEAIEARDRVADADRTAEVNQNEQHGQETVAEIERRERTGEPQENAIHGAESHTRNHADFRDSDREKEKAQLRANVINAPREGAGKPYFVRHREWTKGEKVYGQHESYRQSNAVERLGKIEQQELTAKEHAAKREADRQESADKRLVQERTAHEGRGGLEHRNYAAEAEQIREKDKMLRDRSESTRIPHREAQQGEKLDGKLIKQEIVGTERVSIIEQQKPDGTKERVVVPGRVSTMPGNEVEMTVDRNKKVYPQQEVQPKEREGKGIDR